jgi:N utilization substance protein A
MPQELVATLEKAGRNTLRDILDLEREDVLKIEGMTPEHADVLMGFLTELTEENEQAAAPPGSKTEAAQPPEASPAG